MIEIHRALAFLDREGRAVDAAWCRVATHLGGNRNTALLELAKFQNDDGGFGHRLEPDIAAPESNPFAARIALQICCAIDAEANAPLIQHLLNWLTETQGEDGGWRFAPAIYDHALAPWFAAWTWPSLNPSLDLAGYVARLGWDAPALQQRTLGLFANLASVQTIEEGGFYNILPFVEYTPWVDHPDHAVYLAALVRQITSEAKAGKYDDAGHFFEHVGPVDGPIAGQLPAALIASQLNRLRTEQQADGGWPTPYDVAWRSWATARNAVTLAAFGGGVS